MAIGIAIFVFGAVGGQAAALGLVAFGAGLVVAEVALRTLRASRAAAEARARDRLVVDLPTWVRLLAAAGGLSGLAEAVTAALLLGLGLLALASAVLSR